MGDRAETKVHKRLRIVGSGIRAGGQMTAEAAASIRAATSVLYLVADPATEQHINDLNENANSLDRFYAPGKAREKTYDEITKEIHRHLDEHESVCVVFYGHPGVLVDSARAAILEAKRRGIDAKMLPGISSLDNLAADLDVDPFQRGCQIFEANYFLLYEKVVDPSSGLILFQIGAIGESSIRDQCSREHAELLRDYLLRYYSPDTEAILYEASSYVILDPSVISVRLHALADHELTPGHTLFIPAARVSAASAEMVEQLGLVSQVE